MEERSEHLPRDVFCIGLVRIPVKRMLDLKEVGFSGSSVIVSQELVLWSSGAFVFGSEASFRFSIQFPGNITEDLLMAEANDTFDTFLKTLKWLSSS